MERIDPHGATDLRGFAERMSQVPLAADPGTRFGYDGASLELLARVVEVVSRAIVRRVSCSSASSIRCACATPASAYLPRNARAWSTSPA